jgi:hypothetical protein
MDSGAQRPRNRRSPINRTGRLASIFASCCGLMDPCQLARPKGTPAAENRCLSAWATHCSRSNSSARLHRQTADSFLDEHSGKIYWHLEEYRTKCRMIPAKARDTSHYVMAEDRMQTGRAGAEATIGA